jgi:hypothetical protein
VAETPASTGRRPKRRRRPAKRRTGGIGGEYNLAAGGGRT